MQSESDGQEFLSHLLGCVIKSLLAISVGSAVIYIGYQRRALLDPVTLALYAAVGIGAVLYGIRTSLRIASPREDRGEIETFVGSEFDERPGPEAREEFTRGPAPRERVERPRSRLYQCPECGAPVTSGGKFCGKCGTVLRED